MFRRIVAIFVIVGVIAGQWLAMPHAHGAATGIPGHAHSSSPHIHLSWFFGDGFAHEHAHQGHEHGNCGHEHHESSSRSPAVAVADSIDHDADALYISIDNSSVGSTTRGVSVTTAKILLALSPVLVGSATTLGFDNSRQNKPEFRAPSCALYLQLRTLRI